MTSSVGDIIEKITEYIQVKTELIKLKVIGIVSRVLANVISAALIGIIAFFFFFFLSFSIGSYLNGILQSEFLGHLIVAAFYLLLIIIILLLAKTGRIQSWLENLILNIVEQEDEQED
ncbi:MAG: phage holin family protein [Cyclobacteriaceae bacterium]